MRHRIAMAAVAAAVLALPAAAGAATKTVDMGLPLSSQKLFEKSGLDVNDFFPHGVTIHVGDSIRFVPAGFHTVEFPAKGAQPFPFVAPQSGTVSGVNDEAGNPFWFNGQPVLGFDPRLGVGLYGKRVSYDGRKQLESGLPLAQHPKPFTVKFTRVGTFTYYCNLHHGMKGLVRVKARNAKIPSAKADARTLKNQLTSDLRIGKPLAHTEAPAGTIIVGPAAAHGVEFFGFAPSTLSVPIGTTVKFQMPAHSFDVHTATTGPGDPETQPTSYLGQISSSLQNSPVPDPRGVYSSEAPGKPPAALTPTLHGNGFWNSGVMDTSGATPLPNNNSVTFSAAGTYTFYCLIHSFMKATITVK